ncbi:MAG: HAD family phosphatase [Pseudomonadales bacterium]|nr:HAD family phosphatase [Pseudomonadales bacterium]NRA16492.1 HAD family phosphatase [Oceanospirillaceae bacterium]
MKVLFDLGNVVLNWDTQAIINSLALSDVKKRAIDTELLASPLWLELDAGSSSEKQIIERLSKSSILSASDIQQCLDSTKSSLLEIDATIDLMQQIADQKISMYCLSNMSKETYAYIKHRPWFNFFEDVVISGEVELIKPNPAIFHHTLEKFSIQAADTLFIDDSQANITTAQQLGFHTILFDRSAECYQQIKTLLSLQLAQS